MGLWRFISLTKRDRFILVEGTRQAELEHQQSRTTDAELIAKLQRARHASQIPG